MRGYTAIVLTEASRNKLLGLLEDSPNSFTNVVAHHVTLEFGVEESESKFGPFPRTTSVEATEFVAASDVGVDCVKCTVFGDTVRADGGRYHITLALADGVKPVASNTVVDRDGSPMSGMTLEGLVTFIPFGQRC